MDLEEKLRLLRRCVDINDCEALFQEYGGLIFNTVCRVLQRKTGRADPEITQEICQDIFVALLDNRRRRLRAYDPDKGTTLEGWLILIANRLTLNRVRRKENRVRFCFLDEFSENYQLGTKGQAENQTFISQISGAVNKLPTQERLVFKLHFMDGLSDDEIAACLRKSKSAVYACKSRARQRLKKILDMETGGK